MSNDGTISTGDALTAIATEAEKGTIVPAESVKPTEPAQPTPEQKAQADQFASKFAALSRKDKQLREREKQIEKRLADLEARSKQEQEEVSKYKSIPERLKKEPLNVLKEYGLTMQELTDMMLNDGKPTPEMMLSEAEKRMQAKLDELDKKLKEKEELETSTKHQQAIDNFKSEISSFITENNNDYELIAANDAADLVYEVIEAHFNDTADEDGQNGTIMDVKEACNLVEQHFLNEAKRHLKLGKVKGLLGPKTEPTPKDRQSSPTLSNTDSVKVPNKEARRLSNEESVAEAAKLIRWDE